MLKKNNSQVSIKKIKLVGYNEILKFYPKIDINPKSKNIAEFRSHTSIDKRKTFVISSRYPALRDAFLDKDWVDGEDEMHEDENYNFDFSYYNFNYEQKGNIRKDQVSQGHKGL